VGGSLPPTDMSVLVYVASLHGDKESIADEFIITGFYSEEQNKWAYDYIEGDYSSWKYFEETDELKVVAWTLLPKLFDYDSYKNYRKKLGVRLFR